MDEVRETSYDAIPYESFALPETHPDRLSALARLFGMEPPGLDACRVLELGCAAGGNLIPLALAMPDARFLGIDLSSRQVEDGRATIAALGLDNIELRALSIMDIGADLGPFEFIICHGVYSWVPADVRDRILGLCGELLTPDGIAYVSYNTYPGWHLRAMVREMMLVHTRRIADPLERVRASRALLQALGGAVAEADDPYSLCLRDEAAQVLGKPDYYLLHEHFADINQPLYVHQFLDHASAHGLQYLAEARFGAMARGQPPELAALFEPLAADPLDGEQLYDFLSGRPFRQTLLCRAGIALATAPIPRAVLGLRASGTPNIAPAPPDADPAAEEAFRSLDGRTTLTTTDPMVKAAVHALHEVWPRSLPVVELLALVRLRLDGPADPDGSRAGIGPEELAAALLDAYRAGVVELHVNEPRFAAEAGERPLASPLARRQVTAGPRVTNLWHHVVDLDDFDRLVLYHLDGRHDRAAILRALQGAVANGAFALRLKGRPPVTDPDEARPLLERLLGPSLDRLAGYALLVG